jgi:transcriptional regulator with XRE-family HTH domain
MIGFSLVWTGTFSKNPRFFFRALCMLFWHLRQPCHNGLFLYIKDTAMNHLEESFAFGDIFMAKKTAKVVDLDAGNPEYGARLAKFRKAAGLSQLELGQKLGIAQSIISRYEKGERRLYDDVLAQAAKILGVTPNDILDVGACKPVNPDTSALARRLVKSMKRIESLPRRAQDKVIATIELALKGATS